MSVLRQTESSISDRAALIQEAFRVEYLTIAWMVIEAAVAIGSAVEANSLTLLAFGIDSLIELASAGVLVWRLTVELRHGQTVAENAERRAARIGGALLFALDWSSTTSPSVCVLVQMQLMRRYLSRGRAAIRAVCRPYF
jgi:hypothetical protein